MRILHRHDRNHVWHERPPWNLRLKKWILHRNDRNHVWGERPPRNLVDHGKSWYRTCRCKPIQIDFPFAANSAQLCVLLSSGIIDRLPSITEAQIKDKSKEDVVVKVLALLQVLQLVVELIIQGLRSCYLSARNRRSRLLCLCWPHVSILARETKKTFTHQPIFTSPAT